MSILVSIDFNKFFQLKNNKFKQSRQHSAIDELRLAFEVAEAKTPGIADRLIEKVTQRMSEYD